MKQTLVLLFAVLLAYACSDGNNRPAIPRPTAYPRVAKLENVFHASDSLSLKFLTNAEANLRIKTPEWFDIEYPQYGATIYVSITPVNSSRIKEVLANRSQRATINIADKSHVNTTEIKSADFVSELYESPSTRSTPLQFISTDGRDYVVSGAVFFSNVAADAPLDSLSPMISQIKGDITKALSEISTWE